MKGKFPAREQLARKCGWLEIPKAGVITRAASALDKAIECGFDDYYLLLRDPDLVNLRRDFLFDRLRDKILHIQR